MQNKIVMQINVCKNSPSNYPVRIDKWPDDIQEFVKALTILQKAINVLLERYEDEIKAS